MARGGTRVRGGGFAADGLPPGRFVDVRSIDGVRLHTEVFGPEDGYPVVLAHGITCALRVWTHQISELARHYRVIAFDHRGHGRSGVPPRRGGYSLDHLAAVGRRPPVIISPDDGAQLQQRLRRDAAEFVDLVRRRRGERAHGDAVAAPD